MEKPSPEENRTESLEMQPLRELSHEEARAGSSGEQRRSLGSQTASPERQDSDEQPSLADTAPEIPDFLFSCESSSSFQNRPTASDTESIAFTQSASEDTPLQDATNELMDYWLKCIEEWYPDRLKQSYFLPSVFFRRVIYDEKIVSGQVALLPQPYGIRRRSSGINHEQSHQRRSQTNPQNQYKPPPPAGAIFTQPNPRSLPPVDHYSESDRVDDDATERFLKCLRYLSKQGGEEEVMMVISQLLFQKYLRYNTSPIKLAQVDWDRLPRPSNMSEQQDGDFDVLIIHRHYGLIVCELKGVGGDRREVAGSDELNNLVAKRVVKAVKQLKKAKEVLNHLVSDIAPVQVTQTLVLPNVTPAELKNALCSRQLIKEDENLWDWPSLWDWVTVQDMLTVINRCLCSDAMPYPADLHFLAQGGNSTNQASQSTSGNSTNRESQSTSGNSTNRESQSTSGNSNCCHWLTSLNCCHWLTGLSDLNCSTLTSTLDAWWKEIKPDLDPHMSDEVYNCLLARFCGPATIVEVPTVSAIRTRVRKKGKLSQPLKVLRRKGEAVAETGLIFSLLALYPDHVTILSNNTLRCVHLYGPPGTGKTIVLVLKALQWLRQGRLVYVVSFYEESRAVSILIESYLQLLLCHNKAPAGNQVPVTAGNQDPVSAGNQDPVSAGNQDPVSGGNQDPVSAGNQDPVSAGNQDPVSAGNQDPVSAGNQDPISAGIQDPVSAGNQDPVSAGNQDPVSAGNQDPVSAGNQDPVSAGNQDPVSAGNQDPVSAGNQDRVSAGNHDRVSADNQDPVSAGNQDPVSAGNQDPVSAGNQDPVSAGNQMITLEVIKQPYAVNAINKLAEKAVGQELCVIADEVAGHSNTGTTGTKDFERFIKDLRERIPTVSVWCASMQKLSHRLTGQEGWMSEEKLTIPLRSPPLVTKEVAMSTKMGLGNIPAYSICPVPAATEGPEPRFLYHGVSQGHKAGSAFTCDLCGQAVVGILKGLNVRGEQEHGTNSLQYRDVIILVTNNIMRGTDDTEPSTKGIVPALRDSGFPVKVLKQGCYNDEDLRDVALALTDQITVTNYEVASGLERMVVIGMGTQAKCKEMYNRLFGMSRCTSQLIWIGKVTEG